jgi:hypothetical protein
MEFLNVLFNSVVRYVLTGALALGCAFLGIALRKKKNAKQEAEKD